MSAKRTIKLFVGIAVVAAIAIAAIAYQQGWLSEGDLEKSIAQAPISTEVQQAKLSPQARRNLSLVSKPVQPQRYWRAIQLPGTIADRPGISDRSVPAPVTGVVT